jgi:hypothetical protein
MSNKTARSIIIVISVIMSLVCANFIPIFESGSIQAFMLAIASLGFIIVSGSLVYVQNKGNN